MVAIMAPRLFDMVSMSPTRSLRNCRFWVIGTDCMLTWYGMELCAMGEPSGRVMLCTMAMPRIRNRALAILSSTIMSVGLRMSWSDSTIRMSGFRRAALKCFSAAV